MRDYIHVTDLVDAHITVTSVLANPPGAPSAQPSGRRNDTQRRRVGDAYASGEEDDVALFDSNRI